MSQVNQNSNDGEDGESTLNYSATETATISELDDDSSTTECTSSTIETDDEVHIEEKIEVGEEVPLADAGYLHDLHRPSSKDYYDARRSLLLLGKKGFEKSSGDDDADVGNAVELRRHFYSSFQAGKSPEEPEGESGRRVVAVETHTSKGDDYLTAPSSPLSNEKINIVAIMPPLPPLPSSSSSEKEMQEKSKRKNGEVSRSGGALGDIMSNPSWYNDKKGQGRETLGETANSSKDNNMIDYTSETTSGNAQVENTVVMEKQEENKDGGRGTEHQSTFVALNAATTRSSTNELLSPSFPPSASQAETNTKWIKGRSEGSTESLFQIPHSFNPTFSPGIVEVQQDNKNNSSNDGMMRMKETTMEVQTSFPLPTTTTLSPPEFSYASSPTAYYPLTTTLSPVQDEVLRYKHGSNFGGVCECYCPCLEKGGSSSYEDDDDDDYGSNDSLITTTTTEETSGDGVQEEMEVVVEGEEEEMLSSGFGSGETIVVEENDVVIEWEDDIIASSGDFTTEETGSGEEMEDIVILDRDFGSGSGFSELQQILEGEDGGQDTYNEIPVFPPSQQQQQSHQGKILSSSTVNLVEESRRNDSNVVGGEYSSHNNISCHCPGFGIDQRAQTVGNDSRFMIIFESVQNSGSKSGIEEGGKTHTVKNVNAILNYFVAS